MAIPKTALVTGAARRIGRAIAVDLAARGWSVVVHHNSSVDEASAAVADIEAAGGRAVALAADLAREDQTKQLMADSIARFGPIGCLINNASRFDRDEIDTATRASWDAHIEPNLRAPFVLSQDMAAALPADREGVIVNILDQRVWNLTPHFLSYTLSKTGLWTLTQTLAIIRESAGRMRELLVDVEQNVANVEDFPMLAEGSAPCGRCAFRRTCLRE